MTQERWQVSESAATLYERYAVGGFFSAFADDLLRRAALQAGERVLDLACGTGIVARKAAPAVGTSGSVTGADLNPGMLAEAQRRVPHALGVVWQECDAAAMPFADASFDVVLCQQGMQFMPDKPATAAEIRRVLAPGGRALASVWRSLDDNPFMAIVAGTLGRRLGPEIETMMGAPFAYSDAETISTLFREAGFADVRTDVAELATESARDPNTVRGMLGALPMAERVAAMPEEARAAMLREMLDAIPGSAGTPAVLAPQSTHVVTGRG